MPAEPTTGPISVEEYLQRILSSVQPMEPFEHSLMDALGLPVAEDVLATVSLPNFDNSGMDGYAVSFRDVAEATEERPLHLPVVGEIAAGRTTIFDLTPGTAVRIMTGAPVPSGCTAVVPFEWTSEEGTEERREVVVRRAPEEGQHIRRAGEEIAEGDVLMRAGEVIGPAPARPARRGGPRQGAHGSPATRGGDVDRHRARRTGTPSRPRQHLRRQQLPARRGGARPRWRRLPRHRHAPTTRTSSPTR